MSLRDRLRRLERNAEGEVITIPQRDGSVRRFPGRELAPAYISALDRALGRAKPHGSEHPLLEAARNSSDPQWRDSFYATEAQPPVSDLSE